MGESYRIRGEIAVQHRSAEVGIFITHRAPELAKSAAFADDKALLAMHNFNEELQKAGVLLDLGGLTPTSRGVRVKYSGSKRTVINGPFAEAKEMIAGYSLLEVKTLAEAVEWAKRAPFGLGVQDGEEPEVELRPLFDPTDFDVPGEAEERAKRLGEKLGKAWGHKRTLSDADVVGGDPI